jgi:hypothetical protein
MSWSNSFNRNPQTNRSNLRNRYNAVPTDEDYINNTLPATAPQPRASNFDRHRGNAPPNADHLAQGQGELQYASVPRRIPPPALAKSAFTPDRKILASYLLGVKAAHAANLATCSITPRHLDLLRDMTDIQSAAKAMFPLGHPNCPEDIERTGGANRALARAVHKVILDFFGNNIIVGPKNSKYLTPAFDWGNSRSTSRPEFKKLSNEMAHGIYAHFGVMSEFSGYSPCYEDGNSQLRRSFEPSSNRPEIRSAILFQAQIKEGFTSQFIAGEKYSDLASVDMGDDLNKRLKTGRCTKYPNPTFSAESPDSAVLGLHGNRNLADYQTYGYQLLKILSNSSSLAHHQMVDFSRGLNEVAPKLAAAVFKAMTPQKVQTAKEEATDYLVQLRGRPPRETAYDILSSKSQIESNLARAAAEAINALTTGEITQMAIEIAQYLGASPEKARAEAPAVIASAKQLDPYRWTPGAGPA